MLTHLLAIFIVILLLCPPVAEARDNRGLSEVSEGTGAKAPKAAKSAAELSQKAAKSKTTEEASSDEEVEPTVGGDRCPLPTSQEEDVRVLTARLKGSLCVSCLYHLEKKIQELGGVKSARVIRPPKNAVTGANERAYAQVQIVYQPSKLNPKKIRQFVQRNDFGIRDEKDVAMTDDFQPLPDPFQKERSSVINAQFK
jgi:hypothetical protein